MPWKLLLPPWRLGNSVRSASDEEIDGLSDGAIGAEWAFAAVVIIGVVLELRSPVSGDWLVAGGIAFEVLAGMIAHLCQAELTRRSNDRLAQVEFESGFTEEKLEQATNDLSVAQRKLADAIDRLAKVQTLLGPRLLDAATFVRELRGKPKAPVIIWYLPDTSDGTHLASSLFTALHMADWEAVLPQPIPDTPVEAAKLGFSRAMAATAGQPNGVTIVASATEQQFDSASPFKALFNAIGKSTDRGVQGASSQFLPVPIGTLRVVIAAKPDPILALPEWL